MDGQAAALIVHDIKNALGVLEGQLQALSVTPDGERAAEAWRSCSALREKLIGFLTLYKASTGGLHAQVEALNPADFLKLLLADTPHQRAGLQFSIESDQAPMLGFFDEHLVALALEAALQNAARFARSAVVLRCTKAEASGIVFSVSDDGPGLDGPGLDSADAGVQAGATAVSLPARASGSARSTGLGMELCRAVANAHRKGERVGTCDLFNAPSGGAVFALHLP